jgi:flagellar basal body P-ring protein FlgI
MSAFNRDFLDRSQVIDIKQSIKSGGLTSVAGVKERIRRVSGGSSSSSTSTASSSSGSTGSSSRRARVHNGAGLNRRLNRQARRKGILKILAGVAIVGGLLVARE